MVKVGLYVRLEAKPGKEAEVEELLKSGSWMVQDEPGTTAWFALRMGRSTFGIFDAFADEHGRQSHLNGKLAQALMEKAPDLLSGTPFIQEVDLVAAKMPGGFSWRQKATPGKIGAALGLAGVIAAGWLALRRRLVPSNRYEAWERTPISTPL